MIVLELSAAAAGRRAKHFAFRLAVAKVLTVHVVHSHMRTVAHGIPFLEV